MVKTKRKKTVKDNKGKRFSPEEVKEFKKLFPNMSNAALAKKFKRNEKAIRNKAFALRLRKSSSYMVKLAESRRKTAKKRLKKKVAKKKKKF